MSAIASKGPSARAPLPTLRGLPPAPAPLSASLAGAEIEDEKSGISLISAGRRRALRRESVRAYRRPGFYAPEAERPFEDLHAATATEWPPRPQVANDTDLIDDLGGATATEWPPRAAVPASWEDVDVSDLDGVTFVDPEPPCRLEDEPSAELQSSPPVILAAVAAAPLALVSPAAPAASSFLRDFGRGAGYAVAIFTAVAGAAALVTALLM